MKKILFGLILLLTTTVLSQDIPSFSVITTETHTFINQDVDGILTQLDTAEYKQLPNTNTFTISFKDDILVHDVGNVVQIYDIISKKYTPENGHHINFTVKSRISGSTYTYDYFEVNNLGLLIQLATCSGNKCSGLVYIIDNLRGVK